MPHSSHSLLSRSSRRHGRSRRPSPLAPGPIIHAQLAVAGNFSRQPDDARREARRQLNDFGDLVRKNGSWEQYVDLTVPAFRLYYEAEFHTSVRMLAVRLAKLELKIKEICASPAL